MKRRVVITGIGLVSPQGDTPDTLFAAVMAGQSAVRLWEDGQTAPVVAARAPFDVSRWFSRLQLAGVDRVSQFAVAAAEMARTDANMAVFDADTTGIYVGTGMGGADAIDQAYANMHQSRRMHPLTIPAFMSNAPAAHVAMRMHVQGPVYTYSMACASSAVAIAEAAKAIAQGEIESALAGGSEALLVPGVIRAWQSLQTLASPGATDPSAASRPFSSTRSGLVLGEGSTFLMLETRDAALARGARIYAEIAGSGFSCDATHLTRPDRSGQVRALRAALRSSALAPEDIGYCNAHGTATLVGDVVESEALNEVWGYTIGALAVSSTKSMHGHLLGAGGALETAITAMALHHQMLPPSINCSDQDPACSLALVREPGTAAPHLQAAISNSFAFGGSNLVLVLRRVEQAW